MFVDNQGRAYGLGPRLSGRCTFVSILRIHFV
ncbi:unnamed protein product [Chondrus crispus]|uniref:Uncharacterized protein n=1 Tax=Chondrus crispus TaxID=2769 RepID=R7QMS9_CHOCR|nr:unnamed protein product [Chondrus crispus]CDF39399.1 unnamed protein product [Chondrus crispus]|eukprot:XP_005719310.1 unnamed protein product [Chondrus crispus]